MPISTGTSGLSAAQTVFIYAPPYVANIPKGATVTYGEWQTTEAGGLLPVPAIIEIQSGSAALHANNLSLYRVVTIT